jgi:hypothetical protein
MVQHFSLKVWGVAKTVILNRIATLMWDHKSFDHNCESHSIVVKLHALARQRDQKFEGMKMASVIHLYTSTPHSHAT